MGVMWTELESLRLCGKHTCTKLPSHSRSRLQFLCQLPHTHLGQFCKINRPILYWRTLTDTQWNERRSKAGETICQGFRACPAADLHVIEGISEAHFPTKDDQETKNSLNDDEGQQMLFDSFLLSCAPKSKKACVRISSITSDSGFYLFNGSLTLSVCEFLIDFHYFHKELTVCSIVCPFRDFYSLEL